MSGQIEQTWDWFGMPQRSLEIMSDLTFFEPWSCSKNGCFPIGSNEPPANLDVGVPRTYELEKNYGEKAVEGPSLTVSRQKITLDS